MNAYALILCGGSGTRMGADENKTLLKVGGVPAVVRCYRAFQKAVKGIVLVTRAGDKEDFMEAMSSHGCTPLAVITGGDDRQASALNGLMALPADADIALIHDGARPFVTEKVVRRVIAGLLRQGLAGRSCHCAGALYRRRGADGSGGPFRSLCAGQPGQY